MDASNASFEKESLKHKIFFAWNTFSMFDFQYTYVFDE